jgi:hypothetical protein
MSLLPDTKQQVNHDGTLSHQANHIVDLTRPLMTPSGFFSPAVLCYWFVFTDSIKT